MRRGDGGAWISSGPKLPSSLPHSLPPSLSAAELNFSTTIHTSASTPAATMATRMPLLDEQDFNQPGYLADLEDQDINKANNFSWYFYSSQFNETQSNNTAVLNMHKHDPPTYALIHDKKEFDARVRSVATGLQFVVAGEPQGEGQPWLMQRQNKVAMESENRVETFVEGNWYNQGNRILMAPSLLDAVRARLVSPSTCLCRRHF